VTSQKVLAGLEAVGIPGGGQELLGGGSIEDGAAGGCQKYSKLVGMMLPVILEKAEG